MAFGTLIAEIHYFFLFVQILEFFLIYELISNEIFIFRILLSIIPYLFFVFLIYVIAKLFISIRDLFVF